MATIPSLPAFEEHLAHVVEDPSIPLQLPVIEKLKYELTANTEKPVPLRILGQISQVLLFLREDPSPLTELAIKASLNLTFTDIHSLDFLAGLQAPSPPINLLALTLLGKASDTASNAAIIAGNPELVASLVSLWLTTPDTAVAQVALEVLWSLLKVDHLKETNDMADLSLTEDTHMTEKHSEGVEGQGLMWRRMLGDQDVYGQLFSICSLQTVGQSGQLGKREKTVAQGRLMDFITKIGDLDWAAVARSHIHDIESIYHSESLMDFAACHMVDTTDVLTHMTLISFFVSILHISPALEFLISRNLHSRTLSYYLEPSKHDSVDIIYLSGPAMEYLSTYALLHPKHFLESSQTLPEAVLSQISKAFAIPSTQWAHGKAPTGDLQILGSIPRVLLVNAGSSSPLMSIPTKPASAEAFSTLARIFRGPSKPLESLEATLDAEKSTTFDGEAAAARVIYFLYLNDHANFWSNVVAAAEVLALKETALAAIALIRAVLTSTWAALPTEQTNSNVRFRLPTEDQILGPETQGTLPASGVWALLVPPALNVVLPFLFKPPQTFSNFVSGGAGDKDSAVWVVATAKFDVLVTLHQLLRAEGAERDDLKELLLTLERRVAQGPWGSASQIGGRVDALEL